MNIEEMTIGEARQIASMFSACMTKAGAEVSPASSHDRMPVVVCTDKRGVVFGYTDNAHERPIRLESARMALYWSSDVGGVFGLADKGPTKDCKISAVAPTITLEGVTAVFEVSDVAEKAWTIAKTQGR